MLETLKIKDWQDIPPFEYFLTPMQKKLDDVRDWLIHMRNLGPDRCKYILEDNVELQDKIMEMVRHDNTV